MNLLFEAANNLQLSSLGGGLVKAAQRAIKGFQTNGGDGQFRFDPQNQDQIRTYMRLRLTAQRVTAQQLEIAMENKKTELSQGGAMRMVYWGVPKRNFPNGLPEKI